MQSDPLAIIKSALARKTAPSSGFDLHPEVILPEGSKLRAAGVLVPFIAREGALQVILTKRSSALKHHPGQIAFPGGKQEDSDTDVTAAALREAEEEIGLERGNVAVFGTLPVLETVTGFRVTPVLGLVKSAFTPRPEPGEVEEVFEVPFAHLANPDNYQEQSWFWRGERCYYPAVPYGPYYIWGATARMLHGLARRMAK